MRAMSMSVFAMVTMGCTTVQTTFSETVPAADVSALHVDVEQGTLYYTGASTGEVRIDGRAYGNGRNQEKAAEQGIPERDMWRLSWRSKSEFDPVWDMVLEGSTGYSGSFARQVTLNQATSSDEQARDLLVALEASAAEGGIVLQGEGVLLENEGASGAFSDIVLPDHRAAFFDLHPAFANIADRADCDVEVLAFLIEFDIAHPVPAAWWQVQQLAAFARKLGCA